MAVLGVTQVARELERKKAEREKATRKALSEAAKRRHREGKFGQRRPTVCCGRRHCSKCGTWRHVVYFGVNKWTDKKKTIAKSYKSWCQTCEAGFGRRYSAALREKQRREKQLELPHEAIRPRTLVLSRAHVVEINLEGGLPIEIGGWSLADEDYDLTPVPTGCPGCWERDCSEPCIQCPDPDAWKKRRAVIKQGLVLRV